MYYWQERLNNENIMSYDRTLEQSQRILSKCYRQVQNDIANDVLALYEEIQSKASQGIVRINDFYRYDRLYKMQDNINKRLKNLGEDEIRIMSEKLNDMYFKAYEITNEIIPNGKMENKDFALLNDRASNIINNVWCPDGKAFSSRVWGNKALLQDRLNNGIYQAVVMGENKDNIVKDIMENMNVGFNQADRIIRTELNYVQNKACTDSYKDAGFNYYEFLAEIDSRTSDICNELNGKVFSYDEMQVGVNAPPMHPNCRSTIIPVLN